MSVVIRLTRTGKTHNISYRIVVQDKHTKRDGKFIENLGFFNPNKSEKEAYKIDKSRFDYWVSCGAKPSQAVKEIVEGNGKRPVKPKKPRKDAKLAETPVQASQQQTPAEAKTDPVKPPEPESGQAQTEQSVQADTLEK